MKHLYLIALATIIASTASSQSTRTVLLETSESTWAEPTSVVICAKEDAKSQFDDSSLVVISFHVDNLLNGGDPFYKNLCKEWAETFDMDGFGAGGLDRKAYNGSDFSIGEDGWADSIAARINRPTDGEVHLPEVLYDPDEDEIFVRVNLQFTDTTFGKFNREMRFFLYVTEDNVEADQVVDFVSIGSCTEYPAPYDSVVIGLDTYLVKSNYKHNNVAVANPSGYEGTDGIISQQVHLGQEFNSVYSFGRPSGTDIDNLRIVAFVANYSDDDIDKNELINAAQASSFTEYDSGNPGDPNHPDNEANPNSRFHPDNWATSVEDVQPKKMDLRISPMPISDLGVVRYDLPKSGVVTVSIFNVHGQIVQTVYSQRLSAGDQKAAFSASQLENGVYFVKVSSEEFEAVESIVIAK